MKKIMIMFLIGIFLILSGCSSADIEPHDGNTTIHNNFYYEFDSMSFTNTSESDILYLLGDQYLDFKYIYNILMDEELSIEEELAYQDLFVITKALENTSRISLNALLSYSSSEFNAAADNISVDLGLQDIVLFNTLKTVMIELKELSEGNSYSFSRLDYIEKRLNTDLTDFETLSLEFLQQNYSELYNNTYNFFNIKEKTLDDLLIEFSTYLNYIPSEDDLVKLETAYSLIQDLINE